jgi:stage V sporulation protein G
MEITEVRIRLADKGKLKAFATITLDDCFAIHGLKIIEGQKGMFVAMPSERRGRSGFQDVAHPVNNSTRNWLEDIVLAKYEEALARPESGGMEASGVRSPLYPPIRPLFGWQARELFDGEEDQPGTLGAR